MSTPSSDSKQKIAHVGWFAALVAALVAAGLSIVVANFTRTIVPLPAEYAQLHSDGSHDTQSPAAIKAKGLRIVNEQMNLQYMLAGIGIGMAAVFGFLSGVKSSGIARGVVACLSGSIVAAALAYVLAPKIALLPEQLAMAGYDPFLQAILIHCSCWAIVAVAFVVAIGVGTCSIKEAGTAAVIGLLGVFLGVTTMVLLGATLEQMARVEIVFVDGEKTKMLWAAIPSLMIGLIYAWTKFRSPVTATPAST